MEIEKEHREQGYIEVEAAVILPIACLSVLLLLYLSLFLFQRASLQASLETCLVYYKNIVTDTYVTKEETLGYTKGEDDYMGAGNTYLAEEPLNPYRGMFGDGNNLNSQEGFEEYFKSVAGGMLFDDDLKVTIQYNNYVFLKEFKATAVQTVSAPINFGALGVGNEYTISVAARVAVADHDGLIRDVDYVIDLVEDTPVGDMARNMASQVKKAYDKMVELLH